ncbi:MAG: lipoyl synthase [Candidatus Comchoanobacterales bacterium]
MNATTKQRNAEKLAKIPIKIENNNAEPLPKPPWLKIKLVNDPNIQMMKNSFKDLNLHTVCQEANCPNLSECYSQGIATFMIMGDRCTRRCAFCDVAHGRPDPLDPNEPINLAEKIQQMNLKYIVITSVDRDDLRDGGAQHFVDCMRAIKERQQDMTIEILVPDFRGRMDKALAIFATCPPDVFNHNIETVPRLYKIARAGSDYQWSLTLLQKFKEQHPNIPTKSGIMLGLGETDEEILQTLHDLRQHQVDMITMGQYLSPSKHHMPVDRYVSPESFAYFAQQAKKMGFTSVASGPLVRSSYHADKQHLGEEIT